MLRMRAVQVSSPNGPLELVERDIPTPGAGQVRIKVHACGICHGDAFTKLSAVPGMQYPRIPGHEVVGVVDGVGPDVPAWELGARVGVSWHCGHCVACRRGNFCSCTAARTPGVSYDGGYADFMIAPFEALVAIPDELSAAEAAPLLCAGTTTFNALRHGGAGPGDVVAVLGIGGLGHLGVQFAVKMGCQTVAIARGTDKERIARLLGAHHYIDSTTQNVAAELIKLGGARVLLATVTDSKSMSDAIPGLGIGGKLLIVGAAAQHGEVPPTSPILGERSLAGRPPGTANDLEDTLDFSVLSHVRPMIEPFPLERASEAYERMTSGKARFRVVLTTDIH
jgi:D-arabinose 1-dehydrogenase-like Zn-dependent alcohol dehydrogenase